MENHSIVKDNALIMLFVKVTAFGGGSSFSPGELLCSLRGPWEDHRVTVEKVIKTQTRQGAATLTSKIISVIQIKK